MMTNDADQGMAETGRPERNAVLDRTAGALSPEEADELSRTIEEGCEKIEMQRGSGLYQGTT